MGRFREWFGKNLPGWGPPTRKRGWLFLFGYILIIPGSIQKEGVNLFPSSFFLRFPWPDWTIPFSFLLGWSLFVATFVVSGIYDLVFEKGIRKGVWLILGGVLLAGIAIGPPLLVDRLAPKPMDESYYSSCVEQIEKKLERTDLTSRYRAMLSRNRASYIFQQDGSLESYQTLDGKTVLFGPSEDDWRHRLFWKETQQSRNRFHRANIVSVWYFGLLILGSAGVGTAVCLRNARRMKDEGAAPGASGRVNNQ